MVLYSTPQYFHLKPYYLWFYSPMINGPMDKVSRGPRDNGANGQRVISSTQGQGLLKKNGQFELVSEEGPSCLCSLFANFIAINMSHPLRIISNIHKRVLWVKP